MPEHERFNTLTPSQREAARQLATTSPIGFWEAVDYLQRAAWDTEQARVAVQVDDALLVPGYRLVGKRYIWDGWEGWGE